MLLQKRTSQEREQQQTGRDRHTLGLYKVQHTHRTQRLGGAAKSALIELSTRTGGVFM